MIGKQVRWMLCAGIVLGGAGCGHHSEEDSESVAARPVVEVQIGTVELGSLPEVLRATGSTKVLRQENVSSPVDGKLSDFRVLEGESVQGGTVLARVETRESWAAVNGAQMMLARAHSETDRQHAQADLDRALENRTLLDILAPFAGVVASRGANEGEFVTSGATLATVVDLSSLCFVALVPARDLSRLRLGQPAAAAFESAAGKRYACRVENIKPQIDPVAQMAEVRLRFTTHPLDLRADMFGTADIVVQQHDGLLLVSDAAVLRDDENGEHTVVEAVGDTLAIARQVQTGIETSDTVEIRGPAVHAGMHVVVAGHYGLPDSTRIRVAGMQPDDSLAAPRRTTER